MNCQARVIKKPGFQNPGQVPIQLNNVKFTFCCVKQPLRQSAESGTDFNDPFTGFGGNAAQYIRNNVLILKEILAEAFPGFVSGEFIHGHVFNEKDLCMWELSTESRRKEIDVVRIKTDSNAGMITQDAIRQNRKV